MSATGWYLIEDLETSGGCRWFTTSTQARGVISAVIHRVADRGARRVVVTRKNPDGSYAGIVAQHDGFTWRHVAPGKVADLLRARGEID
jgi:hypothetical protein